MRNTCQKCGRHGPSNAVSARVGGWRIWSGETLGGKPSEVCFCPACFGSTGGDPGPEDSGWDAQCETCGACMSEDTETTSKADAEEWQDEHECEPEVTLIPPKVKVGA